jgi:hypothetical protein
VIAGEKVKQKKNTILTKYYKMEFRTFERKYLEVREIREEVKKG